MKIISIKAEDFRNYESFDLELSGGTNLFYGDNAQGKTNILEAAFLCGTTRSHRTSKDREMIRFGREESHIRMEILKNDIPYRIDMHLKMNKSKGIAINGVPIRKAGELIGLCHLVFFSPEDLGIIKNSPSERRKFMDMELCQLEKLYLHQLSGYQRALMQRNKLLKDMSYRDDYAAMLDVWDEQLIRYGCLVIQEREKFIERLRGIIKKIHDRLSGGREELTLCYDKNVSTDTFRDALIVGREKDIHLKTTGCGPHRDDLVIFCNGIDLRKFGSQGQQRTAALSLKLAEIELVRQETGDMPVLLLDDVLSELDSSRQHFLLDSIEKTQTLITGTGARDFEENSFQIDRLFHVEKGHITT